MIRIRLFGGVSVALPGDKLPQPAATQTRRLAILALIAQGGERGVSRERLHTLLWPDATEDAARRGLTQALYALRTGFDAEELFNGVQQLQLNRELASSDVLEYDEAIAGGELERAATLYAGPFLDGFRVPGAPEFERRVEELRDEYGRRQEALVERLAARATERGDHARAAEWWRQRAGTDPLNSRVAESYMRALAATGDRAAAIRHARVHEQLVRQELGADASPSVLALAEQFRSEPAGVGTPVQVAPVVAATPVVVAPAPRAPEQPVAPEIAAPDVSAAATPVAAPVVPPVVPPVVARVPTPVAPPVVTPVAPPMMTPVAPPVVERSANADAMTRRIRLLSGALVVTATVAAGALTLQRGRGPASANLDDVELNRLRIAQPQRIAAEEQLELDPAVSPDGRTIAYVSGAERALQVYVRQRDGSQAVAVAPSVPGNQRRPHWSPDGTQLVFESDRGIWLVPALGGTARLVVESASPSTPAASAVFSPDGRELAWAMRDSVFRMALAGGTPRPVAAVGEAHSLAWSPDGRWIAAISGNEQFVVGGALDPVGGSSGIGNLAPSALVLLHGGAGAAPARGDSTGIVRVVLPPTILNASPAWLDRRTLIFVSNRGGTRDLFTLRLTSAGAPAGDAERLTAGLDAHSVSVSGDGRQLAYGVFRHTSNVWSLPLTPTATGTLASAVRVTEGAQVIEGLDVSYDGRWLAYDSDASGQQDIYRLPLRDGAPENTAPERIVSDAGDDFHPTLSPDGRWIAFYSFRDNTRRAAYVPAAGGVVRLVHPQGPSLEEHSPVWSPDGRSLFFFRDTGTQLDLFRVDRVNDTTWSASRRLTRAGGWGASFTSDGTRVTYFAANSTMRMTDSTGAEARSVQLTTPAIGPARVQISSGRIAPDGTGLIVKGFDGVSGGFWWLPLEGTRVGVPRLLLRLDDSRRASPRPEFASDGRHLFFTLAERAADVWAVQLEHR